MPAARNNKRFTGFIKSWLPVAVCMGVIFYASGLPAKDIPFLFHFQNITFHLSAYLVLALLFARGLKNTCPDIGLARLIFFTVIFVFLYGISDEFHQAFVPNRYVSGFDVFIDTTGGFAGSMVYSWRR